MLKYKLAALALVLAPTTCAHTNAPGASACVPWKTIQWYKKDTAKTIDQVKGNNARRAAYCDA